MPIHEQKKFTGQQLEVKSAGNVSEKIQLPKDDSGSMPEGCNYIITKQNDTWHYFDNTTIEEVEEEVTFTEGVAELAKKVANEDTLVITANEYEDTVERENNTCTELTLSDYRWFTDTQLSEWKSKKIIGITSVKIADVDVPTDDYYIGVGTGFDRFLFIKASRQSEYSGKTATAVVRREGAEQDETLTLKNLSNSLWVLPVAESGNPELLQCINRTRSNREERIWFPDGTSIGPENRDGDGFFDGAKILAIPGGDINSNHGDNFYEKYNVSMPEHELNHDDYTLGDDRKTVTLAEGVEAPAGAVADYLAGDMCETIAIVANNSPGAAFDKVYTKGLFWKHTLENWHEALANLQEDIQVK